MPKPRRRFWRHSRRFGSNLMMRWLLPVCCLLIGACQTPAPQSPSNATDRGNQTHYFTSRTGAPSVSASSPVALATNRDTTLQTQPVDQKTVRSDEGVGIPLSPPSEAYLPQSPAAVGKAPFVPTNAPITMDISSGPIATHAPPPCAPSIMLLPAPSNNTPHAPVSPHLLLPADKRTAPTGRATNLSLSISQPARQTHLESTASASLPLPLPAVSSNAAPPKPFSIFPSSVSTQKPSGHQETFSLQFPQISARTAQVDAAALPIPSPLPMPVQLHAATSGSHTVSSALSAPVLPDAQHHPTEKSSGFEWSLPAQHAVTNPGTGTASLQIPQWFTNTQAGTNLRGADLVHDTGATAREQQFQELRQAFYRFLSINTNGP